MKCTKCGDEKADDQMKPRAGKPSKVCIECDAAAKLGRKSERDRVAKIVLDAKGGKKGKKSKTAKKRAKREPEELRVTLPGGGYGFDAFVTGDNRLQISQENENDSDNIVLTKSEARSIFEKFADWSEAA